MTKSVAIDEWDDALGAATHPKVSGTIIDLFAGPGGWDMGARILGVADQFEGFEIDRDACETARAAGFKRYRRDVTTLDPARFSDATGLVVSPPCPTFSDAGNRTGRSEDYQKALDAITCLGEGCDCGWQTLKDRVRDSRTALVVEAARWALKMPKLRWMVAEQVPGLEYMWEDIAAELHSHGWESANVEILDAETYGVAARRERTFVIARYYESMPVAPYARRDQQRTSMAQALGWDEGHRIRTRGDRKTSGGNVFSADSAAWCLTEKARTWEREADGLRLTAAEAGLLQGFPRDYPWRGSRTRQFHQAGDVVSPVVAAAVLGTAMGIEWHDKVEAYVRDLYTPQLRFPITEPGQIKRASVSTPAFGGLW